MGLSLARFWRAFGISGGGGVEPHKRYVTATLSPTFLILRRIQRDIATNVQRSLRKVPAIISPITGPRCLIYLSVRPSFPALRVAVFTWTCSSSSNWLPFHPHICLSPCCLKLIICRYFSLISNFVWDYNPWDIKYVHTRVVKCCRREAADNFFLLSYYAASSGNSVPTSRDNQPIGPTIAA